MLNYIWSGLIIFSLLFALTTDVQELSTDRFRNDAPLPVVVDFPDGYAPEARRQPVTIRVEPDRFASFYDLAEAPDTARYEVGDLRVVATRPSTAAGGASTVELSMDSVAVSPSPTRFQAPAPTAPR